MRFEVIMVVMMSMLIFWALMPCVLVRRYHFGETFSSEDGDSMFLQNGGIYL
jgi:hypothetical protein